MHILDNLISTVLSTLSLLQKIVDTSLRVELPAAAIFPLPSSHDSDPHRSDLPLPTQRERYHADLRRAGISTHMRDRGRRNTVRPQLPVVYLLGDRSRKAARSHGEGLLLRPENPLLPLELDGLDGERASLSRAIIHAGGSISGVAGRGLLTFEELCWDDIHWTSRPCIFCANCTIASAAPSGEDSICPTRYARPSI